MTGKPVVAMPLAKALQSSAIYGYFYQVLAMIPGEPKQAPKDPEL
jgi:hypothetical protein